MTSHSVTTPESATDAPIATQLSFVDLAPQAPFPVLPSYEEVMRTRDTSRLPSYRQSRQSAQRRYHPYALRWEPALADGTGLECLQNTIYDEERVDIVPPPPLMWGPPPVQPLAPAPLLPRRALHAGPRDEEGAPGNALDEELRQPDIVAFARRVQATPDVVMAEFLAASNCRGARRARSP